MNKKLDLNICGLPLKYFAIFFVVIMVTVYGGFMPLAGGVAYKGNDSVTEFLMSAAYLMAVGGLFFWLGNTIPIVNNYLGGACLLPLLGASFMNYMGWIPENLVNGVNVVMKGGFQNMYISMLLVGSILVMDRKIIVSATARYIPTILGSQIFAIGFAMLAGLITGFGIPEALFNIAAPCMSGGSGGALTTLPKLYSDLSGTDMTGMSGQFLCYASIANVLAVVLAAVGNGVTSKMKGLNGNGEILAAKGATMTVDAEKCPVTSSNYVSLGAGIFMSFCIYLLGNILGSLPGFSVIPGLAWTIILGIVIKVSGILPVEIEDSTVYSMQFALKALLPMLIAGIGISSLNFASLSEYFSIGAFIVIIVAVLGAMFGAMLFGKLSGLWAYEAGITAGLCCCNIGGSGDIAVLSAANRMNLLAFASISTRIGGALMVIWIGLLYPLFH